MAYEARVPLPDEVAALAQRERMGSYVRTFHPSRGRPAGAIVAVVTTSVIVAAIALLLTAMGFPGAGVGVLILLAAMWIVIIAGHPVVNPLVAARKVHLFEQGFIPARASGQADHFRWDAIDSVVQRVTGHYYEGVSTGRIFRYTVRRNDGATVKLTQFYDGIEQLGQILTAEVTRVQLPRAMAAIQQGWPARFGPLIVDASGLAQGTRRLPWTELKDVEIRRGNVVVHQTSGFSTWTTVPAAIIPNLHVFLTLIDQLSRRQPS